MLTNLIRKTLWARTRVKDCHLSFVQRIEHKTVKFVQRTEHEIRKFVLRIEQSVVILPANINSMEALYNQSWRLIRMTSLDYIRPFVHQVHWNQRLVSIRGARGVGKTTLLLQYIKQTYGENPKDAIYVSLDNLYFSRHTFLEFVDEFYKMGGKHIFADEVHKYQGWSQELKNAYDSYPDMRFVITGSSVLNILNSDADLSRRCINYNLQGLSFREYLQLCEGITFDAVSLPDLLHDANDLCAEVNAKCRPLAYFDKYLRQGYYPYILEGKEDYYERISNVANLILEIELPQLCGVDVSNIRKLKSLLAILASEYPMQLDMMKLSSMAGMSRTTLLAYLQHLQRARLINLLYSGDTSLKKMQRPDKIYMENTNLMHALSLADINEGTQRETFFVNQVDYLHRIEYASSQADFLVDGKYTIEVGGKSKDGKQIANVKDAYIAADGIENPFGNKIPLWCFGFLY